MTRAIEGRSGRREDGPMPDGSPMRTRVAAALRPRLTLLSAPRWSLVSALLLWLGWLLVGGWRQRARAPARHPGAGGDQDVTAEQVSDAVGAAARTTCCGPG